MSYAKHYPKTLVLTESPFASTNGFGVTLATLMAEWPLDSFLVLYRSQRFWDDTSVQLQSARERMVHMPLPGRPLLNPVHLRELKDVFFPYVFGRTPSWFGRYSTTWLEEKLGDWRPEVIYSWYYSPAIAHFGSWLASRLGIPHVIHIGDDVTRDKVDPETDRIVKNAAVRVAISGEMKADFEERHGAPFEVLHNGASEEIFEPPTAPRERNGTLTVRYLGSLLRAHHFQSIEDIAEAVRTIAGRGESIRFEIYCPEWTADVARELHDGESVIYAGFAEKPRNYELLKSADVLALPITFQKDHLKWVRLSMPTKLPEYLGSGTPVLIYGPRGTAPTEFCLENGVGYVHSERSVPALVERLEGILADRAAARERGLRDREVAEATVSARAMRDRLYGILTGAVESHQRQVLHSVQCQ